MSTIYAFRLPGQDVAGLPWYVPTADEVPDRALAIRAVDTDRWPDFEALPYTPED